MKSANTLLFYAFLCSLAAFGCISCKNDPVPAAKEALKKPASGVQPTQARAVVEDELGSEKYLPVQERLRRRQQRTTETLARFGPPPKVQ